MPKLNVISSSEVEQFKCSYCNENRLIIDILNDKFSTYLIPPILDLGSGLGDIALGAFGLKESILLDLNPIDKNLYTISPYHKSVTGDFFEYKAPVQIQTLFISHSLQFLDEDIFLLNQKINKINPQNIIIIINKNDGLMGEILNWVYLNFPDPNPEKKIADFPTGYKLTETKCFSAVLSCPDFETLAHQISYLMMVSIENSEGKMIEFLKEIMEEPKLIINQIIEVYQKNEQQY